MFFDGPDPHNEMEVIAKQAKGIRLSYGKYVFYQQIQEVLIVPGFHEEIFTVVTPVINVVDSTILQR